MIKQVSNTDKATECAACGGPIIEYVGRTKEFCSIPCFRTGRTYCKGCPNRLSQSAKGGKSRFCSPVCRQRYYRIGGLFISSSPSEELRRTTCKRCNRPITQPKNGIKLFCSTACRSRYYPEQRKGLDINEQWGSFAPETRKSLQAVHEFMGIGAAKRLATAIDHEYVQRNWGNSGHVPDAFAICYCKTCSKKFRRRSWSHQSKDYCSLTCTPKLMGERVNARLTWEQADEIRNIHATELVSHTELGKRYGVSRSAISLIVTNKTWKPENHPTQQMQQQQPGQPAQQNAVPTANPAGNAQGGQA